jgi:tetratricopeptide (TPR) repeat protein
MRQLSYCCVLLLFFFFVFPGYVTAQASPTDDEPAWLLVERAEVHLEQGELGSAIRLLRRSIERDSQNPLAHYLLGQAYAATNVPGDLRIALDHLDRALALRSRFLAPGRALLVRYEKASIYSTQRDFAQYEAELRSILAESPVPEELLVPPDMLDAFHAEGINGMLVLYRVPVDGATRARGMLAEFLMGMGRYAEAGDLAGLAVIQSLTALIEGVRERDPLFTFETVEGLLSKAAEYPETSRFVRETTLFHDVYYLAAAFYADRNEPAAVDLWGLLATSPEANQRGVRSLGGTDWQTRARIQLEDPAPEPPLIPRR